MAQIMGYLGPSRFLIISLVLVFSLITITLATPRKENYTIQKQFSRPTCTQKSRNEYVRCGESYTTAHVYYSECDEHYVLVSVTAERCQSGWGPEPDCNDYNECKGNVCDHSCTNTFGSYICSCNTGYRLASDRRTCNDIDECQERISSCSQICHNTVGNYTCDCNTRYTLESDGRRCKDIDECTANTPGCKHNCSNTIGSYTCSCTAGYRLATDGRSCIDIDECTAHLDDCAMLENFTCENTNGSYQCVCMIGFEQVGPRECRDINECETLTNNCTLYESLICENTIGSYKCQSEGTWIRLAIVVTVGVVVGIILIIIAVVCFVKRAKKRKRNAEESSRRQASSEIEYEEVADVSKKKTKTKLDDLNTQEHCSITSSCSTPEVKKDLKSEKATEVSNYQELASVEKMNQVYEAIRKSSKSKDISAQGTEKSDSKEAATGESTSDDVNKGAKGLLKSQKGKKDLHNKEATTESNYQDLVSVTEISKVYEAIRKPSKSKDISVHGETNKDFKEKKDLGHGEATSDSAYQELSATAKMKDVYEPIKKQP